MAKKGIGGVIAGSIVLFLGAIIITAGVGGRVAANSFLIEPMVGTTFQDIEDQALPTLKASFYSQFLLGVKDAVIGAFGGTTNLAMFINCSTSMQVLGQTIPLLAAGYPLYYGSALLATWGVFNDTIQLFGSPVKGVVEWSGAPITYTLNDAINLTQGSSMGLPGFLEADPLGDGTPGMLAFIAIYANPSSVGFPDVATLATVGYGLASGTHLSVVAGWITTELYNFVPTAIQGALGWTVAPPAATATTAGKYILLQWAEKVLIPAGLGTLDPAATNFEVDTDFANMTQVEAVWASVTGVTDFTKWDTGDTSLIAQFDPDLTTTQFNAIVAWADTLEPVMQAGVGAELGITPGTNFYLSALLGQWMELGFLQEEPLVEGFEIDFTPANRLSSAGAIALWTQLKSEEGIKKWYRAVDGLFGAEYYQLKAEHGLVDEQMMNICDYLETWRSETLFALNIEEEKISLPIWGYDIKKALDDLELYLPIGGGVFAVAGVLLIALFARKRA